MKLPMRAMGCHLPYWIHIATCHKARVNTRPTLTSATGRH